MKLSRGLGMLAFLMVVLAIFSIALPVYSTLRIGVVGKPTSAPDPADPCLAIYTVEVHNGGILPLDGVRADLNFSVGGTTFLTAGVPVANVPPGQTVTMHVTFPDIKVNASSPSSVSSLAGCALPDLQSLSTATSANLTGTFTADLGGLIPISARFSTDVPINGSASLPIIGGLGGTSSGTGGLPGLPGFP
ncbi:MAG: hypothetical protein JRN21_05385 [Nitrososphaerota archaeon]|nr:hypothetical protein [Nitrososphaerota archaeon]